MVIGQKANRIILAAFGVLILLFCIDRALKGSDFEVYLEAAKTLLANKNIYNDEHTLDVQYFYSPLFALILAPLTVLLPVFVIKLIWLLLMVFFMYRITQLCLKYLDRHELTRNQKIILVLVPHLILTGFIIDNFHMVQVTFFILWGTLESIRLIFNNRIIAGALLLGLVINIKLLPLPVLCYLIYRKHWKASVLAIFVAFCLLFLPAIFIGNEYNSFLLKEWGKLINPVNEGFVLETNILVFNLPALITSFFIDDAGGNKVLTISYSLLQTLIMISRLVFILLTFIFLGTLPFRNPPSRIHQFREIAYILLVTVLIFPHQNKYATVYLLPSFLYIVYYIMYVYKNDRSQLKPSFYTALAFLPVCIFLICLTGRGLVGRELSLWFAEHKSITIGTILLVPVLLLMKPSAIKPVNNQASPSRTSG